MPATRNWRVNFEYIDRYPHYVFNWTGSNRYRLMKEYFPDDYARTKEFAAKGRASLRRVLFAQTVVEGTPIVMALKKIAGDRNSEQVRQRK